MGTLHIFVRGDGNYAFEALESRDLLTVTSARPVGDVNGDGIVNTQDLALVGANWLRQSNPPLAGDANFDGIVNSKTWPWSPRNMARPRAALGLGNLTPPSAVEGTTLHERHGFTVPRLESIGQGK